MKEAKIDQPTLVKLGFQKLIKTIIDSQILNKEKKNIENPKAK